MVMMDGELPLVLSAFIMGLLGGAHCIGMCGGIIGALSMGVGPNQYSKRLLMLVLYNFGRITSYALIALLVALLSWPLHSNSGLWVMRLLAGLLMIAAGLYLAGWWYGLRRLEKLGGYLWQYLQPFASKLLPIRSPVGALSLGLLWGWLPCGLVYSALFLAATADTWQMTLYTMLAFGGGTLPAVLSAGLLAERLQLWFKQVWLRATFAIIMILLGLMTMVPIVYHPSGMH